MLTKFKLAFIGALVTVALMACSGPPDDYCVMNDGESLFGIYTWDIINFKDERSDRMYTPLRTPPGPPCGVNHIQYVLDNWLDSDGNMLPQHQLDESDEAEDLRIQRYVALKKYYEDNNR